MSELWLAVRDSIGLHSQVNYGGSLVTIKDLEPKPYDLYQGGNVLRRGIGPNIIPGAILRYMELAAKSGEKFSGRSFPEMVNNLEFSVTDAN